MSEITPSPNVTSWNKNLRAFVNYSDNQHLQDFLQDGELFELHVPVLFYDNTILDKKNATQYDLGFVSWQEIPQDTRQEISSFLTDTNSEYSLLHLKDGTSLQEYVMDPSFIVQEIEFLPNNFENRRIIRGHVKIETDEKLLKTNELSGIMDGLFKMTTGSQYPNTIIPGSEFGDRYGMYFDEFEMKMYFI